jgi:hypothetical protein
MREVKYYEWEPRQPSIIMAQDLPESTLLEPISSLWNRFIFLKVNGET